MMLCHLPSMNFPWLGSPVGWSWANPEDDMIEELILSRTLKRLNMHINAIYFQISTSIFQNSLIVTKGLNHKIVKGLAP